MKSARKLFFILFFSLLFLIPSISKAECIDGGICNSNTPFACINVPGCTYDSNSLKCVTSPTCVGKALATCVAPACSWVTPNWGSGDNTDGTTGSGDDTNSNTPIKLDNPLGSVTTPQILIGNIINSVLGVVGSLALLMFIFGGLTWMTSAGSADKVKKGKDIIVWSAIGLVVIFASYGLVRFLILNIK
ncbi:MAG: pilin [Candidatus Falkowbacteria bacterium]